MQPNRLTQDDLNRVYWLGGSTCAGKTTASSIIADQLNWNLYHCDEWEHEQKVRATSAAYPKWYSYSRLKGDELWLMPVAQHIAESLRAYDEQFTLILEDLVKCLADDNRPLLYEGYIFPKNLAPIVPSINHVFYLIATESFQQSRYRKRPWIHSVLAKTSKPEQAWSNWMQRDSTIARLLENEACRYEMAWLSVDGKLSMEDTVQHIINHFAASQTR